MTDTATAPHPDRRPVAEVTGWLDANWDPDLTVGEWWERLGLGGLGRARPGRRMRTARAWPAADAVRVQQEIAEFGALGAPGGLGPAARRPDDRHPRHRGADRPLRPRHRHRAEGVVPALQRARGRLRPGRPADPGRARTATSGSSTARRCGPRAASSPTSACCSPAPTPTSPSTRASPTSPSTCTSRASRSGRSGR